MNILWNPIRRFISISIRIPILIQFHHLPPYYVPDPSIPLHQPNIVPPPVPLYSHPAALALNFRFYFNSSASLLALSALAYDDRYRFSRALDRTPSSSAAGTY